MEHIAGLDIGFSKKIKTNSVVFWRDGKICIQEKTFCKDAHKRIQNAAESHGKFSVIAVDGPILARGSPEKHVRAVERLFIRNKFAKRCKPGMSHWGMGLKFSKASNCAADALESSAVCAGEFAPQVRDTMIVETFPNAFLGLCLGDDIYAKMPKFKRGKKFDWLYDQAMAQNIIAKFSGLKPQEKSLWHQTCIAECDHEKRAGLICALQALLVLRGNYVAIGDKSGWFFLPALEAWADWARLALDEARDALKKKYGDEVLIFPCTRESKLGGESTKNS